MAMTVYSISFWLILAHWCQSSRPLILVDGFCKTGWTSAGGREGCCAPKFIVFVRHSGYLFDCLKCRFMKSFIVFMFHLNFKLPFLDVDLTFDNIFIEQKCLIIAYLNFVRHWIVIETEPTIPSWSASSWNALNDIESIRIFGTVASIRIPGVVAMNGISLIANHNRAHIQEHCRHEKCHQMWKFSICSKSGMVLLNSVCIPSIIVRAKDTSLVWWSISGEEMENVKKNMIIIDEQAFTVIRLSPEISFVPRKIINWRMANAFTDATMTQNSVWRSVRHRIVPWQMRLFNPEPPVKSFIGNLLCF